MENININAGGVIGALVVGLVAAVLLFSLTDGRVAGKLTVGAIVAGAIGGNMLWSALFSKKA